MIPFTDIYDGYPHQTPEYLFKLIEKELREIDATLFERVTHAFRHALSFYERESEMNANKVRPFEPAINHPLRVALILLHERFYDADVLCAAILHRMFIQTDYARDYVKCLFGITVARYIEGVAKLIDAEEEVCGKTWSQEK